jgi:hypothetical protein
MVCGRVIGYQFGSPDAFAVRSQRGFIVDGVMITHGEPRQHIWTFTGDADEAGAFPGNNCDCNKGGRTLPDGRASQPPDFIGNDYFCDTGNSGSIDSETFFRGDALWNGAGCGSLNECCTFNNPPWFFRELSEPTTDDIVMTVCRDEPNTNEDFLIQTAEIFVHETSQNSTEAS